MRNTQGQFKKGYRSHPATEFKAGQHWRKPQPFREKAWLEAEYIRKKRSTGDIAIQFGVTREAVLFWLKRHKIPRRDTSAARAVKHWGCLGAKNPMYGKRGILNPLWQGGHTPWRQAIYSTAECKEFMRQVWARDRVCRLCGAKKDLEIHHIDKVSQAPLLIMDIGNALLLCKTCHNKLRGKERRWRSKLYALLRKEVK